jgi:hypothetical protein
MGGLQAWRTLLLNVLWKHFFEQLPEGLEFEVGMVDDMQYVAPRVLDARNPYLDTESVTQRVREVALHFLNNERDPSRPIINNTVVFMLDTVHNVPKNKAGKQRSRDASGGATSGGANATSGGANATSGGANASNNDGNDGNDDDDGQEPDDVPHMDEAFYEKMCQEQYPLFGSWFTTYNPSAHLYAIPGLKHWRSYTLRNQLYRKITLALMHVPIKGDDRVMIIDDGLAFSMAEYERERAKLIQLHGFQDRSNFQKECLVAEEMTRSPKYIKRFMVWPDGHHLAFDATGIGEADIKIQAYINRGAKVKRFLVVNQDTDIIFILLLHMHTFLYHDERDDEVEVWLDTRSPSSRGAENKPYRYIDIKALYKGIVDLFAREYPHVCYPVQTFCFLVFSLETDFTRKFAPCLKITNGQIWNTFSELHHYDYDPVTVHADFIKYSQSATVSPHSGALVRQSQRTWSPQLRGLLNNAIQYDCVKKRFYVRHDQVMRFFYLLCQQRVMAVRADIGVAGGSSRRGAKQPLMEAVDPEELLIYASDVMERLHYYKNNALKQSTIDAHFGKLKKLVDDESKTDAKKRKCEEDDGAAIAQKKKLAHTPKFAASPDGWLRPNKAYVTPIASSRPPNEIKALLDSAEEQGRRVIEVDEPVRIDIADDDMMPEEESAVVQRLRQYVNAPSTTTRSTGAQLTLGYIQQNEKKLYEYTKKEMPPPFFGVPTVNDMLARVYRIEWYLSYCTDGWRHPGPYGAVSCIEQARHDPSLSMWGWQEVHHDDQAMVAKHLNSTYYTMRYMADKQQFRLTEIVETNRVSHKRVYY